MVADFLEKSSAIVDDMFHEALKLRTIVSDAVEEEVESAARALKRRRREAEHAVHVARRAIERHPLPATCVVFAAGVLTGTLVVDRFTPA